MTRYKTFAAALCASTLLTTPAFAAEHPQLAPVVVTGASTPLAQQSRVNLQTGDFSPIPYTDGGDLLRQMPGMTAGRMGGHGLEPVLRGQSQTQLNIITGGAYAFGGCSNRMDPPSSYLNLDAYDTLTVVRGYPSVLNGPGGSGGSIILDMQAPELGEAASLSGELDAGYDSNGDGWYSGAKLLGGDKHAYVRAYTRVKEGHNYKDGNGKAVRSAYEEKTGGMTVGFTPDDNTHLYFAYDLHRIEDSLFAGAGMDSPLSENQTFRIGAERHFDSGLIRRMEAKAYASLVDHQMDNYSFRTPAMMSMLIDVNSNTYGGVLETDFDLGGQEVRTALEYRRSDRETSQQMGMMMPGMYSRVYPDLGMEDIGLAAETTFDVAADSRLVTGLRYDYVSVDYGKTDLLNASGLSANQIYSQFYGYGAKDNHEHNIGGVLRLEHDLSPSVMLYSGLSRSVRTADAVERGLATYNVSMGTNSSWVGNPDLAPEKHHQLDIGMEVTKPDWQFGGSLYVNRVDDFILRDSARGQGGILVNAPTADIYRNVDALLTGIELQGAWQLSPALRLSGDATYTYGENLDENMALAQIPPLQGKIAADWQAFDTLSFGSQMRWAMRQNRADTDPTRGTGRDVQKTGGYAVFDLYATVTELEPLSLTIGVSNLFDTRYANHLNRSNAYDPIEVQVNEPGRSFYLQAKLPF